MLLTFSKTECIFKAASLRGVRKNAENIVCIKLQIFQKVNELGLIYLLNVPKSWQVLWCFWALFPEIVAKKLKEK